MKSAKENPNFRYLERQSTLARQLREQHTSVSLNREQRQRELEAQEAEQLSLENQRRRALGLPELEEWMDARSDGTTPTEDPEVESEGETEGNEEEVPVDRAHVLEAAEVLLDYVHLQNQQRMAKR